MRSLCVTCVRARNGFRTAKGHYTAKKVKLNRTHTHAIHTSALIHINVQINHGIFICKRRALPLAVCSARLKYETSLNVRVFRFFHLLSTVGVMSRSGLGANVCIFNVQFLAVVVTIVGNEHAFIIATWEVILMFYATCMNGTFETDQIRVD